MMMRTGTISLAQPFTPPAFCLSAAFTTATSRWSVRSSVGVFLCELMALAAMGKREQMILPASFGLELLQSAVYFHMAAATKNRDVFWLIVARVAVLVMALARISAFFAWANLIESSCASTLRSIRSCISFPRIVICSSEERRALLAAVGFLGLPPSAVRATIIRTDWPTIACESWHHPRDYAASRTDLLPRFNLRSH